MSKSVVAALREEVAFLRALVQELLAAQKPAPKAAPSAASMPAAPQLPKRVEDAIALRTYDAASERMARQYAQQMAARGIPEDAIAKAIVRGSAPRETLDDELRQVLA